MRARLWIACLVLLLLGSDGAEELEVASLWSEASQPNLEADLRILSGVDPLDGAAIVSRNIHHPDHARAQAWLRGRLQSIPGLVVTEEDFDGAGEANTNLIAQLDGLGTDPELVIVGAHYDSTASGEPGYDPLVDPAPGADDDASGVSAVLEIARLMAAWPGGFEHDVRFVLFDAEEEGLLGSFEHAGNLSGTVRLMASLDPIGFNAGGEDKLWFVWEERWPETRDALEAQAAALDTYLGIGSLEAGFIGGDERSDHFPFWEAGHPALHVASFPQPPAYHTPEDTFDVVDPRFLREVTGLLAAHFAAVAEPLPVEGAGCACR